MRSKPRTGQWIFDLLVNGFDQVPAGKTSDRVKGYRQERLKRMVLRTLYRDYQEPDYCRKPRGTSVV